jgi:DNA-binding MarR family transcriptional regulator
MKKQSETPNSAVIEAVFHSLLGTWGLLRQVQEPYFARFGITASQWAILRTLQRAEGQGESELPLKQLGQRLLIQPPSVTGVIDRLERLDLVKRSHSKADLRVYNASLTAQGRALVKQVLVGHPDRIKALFAVHEPHELKILLGLLKRLETHLKTMAPRQPVSKTTSPNPE